MTVFLSFAVSVSVVYLNETGAIPIKKLVRQYTIPDLEGMTKEEAELICRMNGISIESENSAYSDKYLEGHIVSQDPKAGSISKYPFVSIALSLGNPVIYMPDLIGLKFEEAVTVLKTLSLEASDVIYELDPENAGLIIDASPVPGEEIDEDTEIVLKIGKDKEKVSVPDLYGKNLYVVKKILANEGLVLGYVKKSYNRKIKEGVVVKQYPEKDKDVEQGTSITVVINSE